jgi:HD-GYP domain-containing protein (c-di-GMP phosphodiesterase class II)
MSEHRQTPASTHHDLAVSARTLQALLEAKAREEDARIAAELTSRRALIEFHETFARKMGRITDPYELARLILREAQDVLGFTHGMLAMVGEDQFLEVAASTEALAPRYRAELLEEAFIVGEALVLEADDEGLSAMGNADVPPGVALRAIPFSRQDGAPLGVLLLEGQVRPDRAAWVDAFVGMVAEALEDCKCYGRLEGLIFDAAIAIARVNDTRTPGQVGHTARVEALSRQLAQVLGLGETMTKRIRLVALLHDLTAEQVTAGFQAIKRGKQTGALWAENLASPFVGGIYASPLADFQQLLGELRYLHCRWDGKGNDPPARGEEIPLAARIVAVAEAFENLTGGRQHRTTLGFHDAVAQIARFAGAQYDPAAVRALAEVFRDVEIEGRVGQGGEEA